MTAKTVAGYNRKVFISPLLIVISQVVRSKKDYGKTFSKKAIYTVIFESKTKKKVLRTA